MTNDLGLIVSDLWRQTHLGACLGVLALHSVSNPLHHTGLEARKQILEDTLRAQYGGLDRPSLRALPILQAYHRYYRRFDKSYHVQLQLESVVFKAKSIPSTAALVESMFLAELKNLLLTAGHDRSKLAMPLRLEAAQGGERFTQLNGQEYELKPGDMYVADQEGILSSVLYGPDLRTCITERTTQVIFTAYVPEGIDESLVLAHLQDIEDNIRLFSPQAQTEARQIYR